MAGRYSNLPPPTRDSLELASLASSSHPSQRTSEDSSVSGVPSSRRLSFDDEDPLSELNPAGHDGRPARNRSYSVSSAFDFAPNLFPLSSTAQGYTALGAPSNPALDAANAPNGGSLEKNKSLTFVNGLSLVIGLIIGSGIFSSPSQVNKNAGSPGASLIVWVVAGVLAWTGAASYAELGGAIPLNGGAQVYLSKIFGEWAGFLFTWCAVVVLKPGSAAIIAIIFGEYLVRAIIGAEAVDASTWLNKGVALVGLFMVTFLNCVSTKLGTRSADVFMFLKFFALTGVTVIGIVVAATGLSYKGHANEDWKNRGWFEDTNKNVSNWAVALYAGLWAFDGWDNVCRISTPIKASSLTNRSGQLRYSRVQKPHTRSPTGHTHLATPRDPLLPPRQRLLLPRPSDFRHRILQHCRSSFRIPSLRPRRLAHPRSLRIWIMFRCSQRHNIHIRSSRLCSRQRRLSPCHVRQYWTWEVPSRNPFTYSQLTTTQEQDPEETCLMVCRCRGGLLLHSNLCHGAQCRPHSSIHPHRLLRHPCNILWRSRIHLLLSDCPRPNHSPCQRARSRTSV